MPSLKQLFHSIQNNDFLRNNGIYFFGSLAFAAINYLYYPVLGRLMATTDFGEVQVILSLLAEVSIFLSVVTNVATNIVANEQDVALANRTVFELERFTLIVVFASLLIAGIFHQQIQSYLQFSQFGPFVALGVALLIGVPLGMRTAFLRGKSAFGVVSWVQISGGIAKILFSAMLVLFGFGAMGAVGGLAVAQFIAFLYAFKSSRKLGLIPHDGDKLIRHMDLSLIKPQLAYTALVLIISLVTTIQFSFDVLVVKHYFDANTAGLYAGIATIARIIYFLTGSFALVLLSNVKREAPIAENRSLLLRSAGLQTIIGGAALLVFIVAPKLVITILLGKRYLPLAGLLPELSLTLFVIAFIGLLLNYDMALRRWSATIVAVVGGAATLVLVALYHATPAAVVRSILLGSLVMLGLRGLDSARRRVWPDDNFTQEKTAPAMS
jgi:O-antigen/teichoic acid export membrane protein